MATSHFIHWGHLIQQYMQVFFFLFNVKLNVRKIKPKEWQESPALIRHYH